MKKYLLQVVIEQDEDGRYVAECPALEGCYTQGDTFEEVMENIEDVIKMCLEELREEKRGERHRQGTLEKNPEGCRDYR